MTMVPSQTISKHHQLYCCGGYVSYCGGSYLEQEEEEEYNETAASGGLLRRSDLAAHNSMAEDESRTTNTNTTTTSSASLINNNNNIYEAAVASSSKDIQAEEDASWLQLSLGASSSAKTNSQADATTSSSRRGGLVELDLVLSPAAASREGERVMSQEDATIFHPPSRRVPSFLFQTGAGSSSSTDVPPPPLAHHLQEINWTFRPAVLRIGMTNSLSLSPTSSSNPPSFMTYLAGPSLDFRIIDPPSRPHSGIWFSLQASQNQAKEPFLPQIPKSYLRIRDGRMTVRLLIKYLVNKLRLDSELEVEITCRGQQLLPFFTLQHVRDNIWNPRDALTLLPDSSTADHHLMVLQYGRAA